MQLRTLALLCSIVGFLYSGLASALGLGEITLKSQYNQPLNAEIRLLKVRDLSEEEILVALASRDDFRRAGVDRLFFLTGLNYEVVLDNPSNPFIRVTTRKAVTEPYLNFLLEVQWPSGRLLREYTLLLDLPVFTEAAPSSTVVTTPTTSTPETVISEPAPTSSSRYQSSSSRPVVSGPEPLASDTTSASYSQAPVDSYRVRSGDTLWEIAENVRSDRSISVHQTMIALQEANPDAFIGGNINRLKNGRVLRVPSAGEIADISYNNAVSAVRRQNQAWASQASNTKAVLTSAAPTTSSSSSLSQPEGRLTLGAADSGQGDVRAAGASASGESLRNDLAAAQGELSRSTRENSELKSRVADLESQIETMEKLVSVTNDQLKALQLATQTTAEDLTSATEETNVEAEPATGVDGAVQQQEEQTVESATEMDGTALAENTEATASEQAVEEQTTADPTTAFEQPKVETPAVASPTVTPPAPEETGFDFIGIIKENLLAVGGALAALLVGILVLLRLREKPEVADYGEFDLADEEDVFEGDELDQPDISDEIDLDVEEEEDVEAQTEDVVAEADIYVSLGQEDKAIELLQKEIQQNPDNADARLGLLKIYAKAQNATAFDEQYAQLLPLGNVYANDQAMALRKEISDVEPFDTDQYSADSDDAFESLDFGDELDDELNLDLDLDGDTDEVGSDSESAFLGSEAEEELSLDIDSDLDIGDLSLDLDAVDDGADDSTDDLSLDTDDGSFSLSDLDDDEAFALDLDLDASDEETSEASSLVDEMSSDLDKLDVEDTNLDDLELDIDSSLDSLGEDLSLASGADDSATGDLEFDLDFEGADEALELDQPSSADQTDSIDDELDLDTPPIEDLDLASLDEEIDAMTAELDDTLPLDKEEPETPDLEETLSLDEPFAGSDLDIDDVEDLSESLSESADLTLDVDDAAASVEEDFAALEDNNEEDIDILAKSELDDLVGEADDAEASVNDLASDDGVTVSSMMDDASISEDEELDFLEESDEVSTKLDLAKAYIDMGDREGAQDILNEVIEEGNANQKTEAQELMRNI